ncbi:hypothetical protein [Streptomyces sp. Da 82-17]|uniref:hypothetical protein n=1 Tax=Streptomyces sp. Da 82-17 TaxID=3377116 RepID=UPI0038D4022F
MTTAGPASAHLEATAHGPCPAGAADPTTPTVASAPGRSTPSADRPASLHAQLVDGLRYIARHPVLRPLVLVLAVAELGFAGPANLGILLLAHERGWGASGLGWIIAGFGVGAGGASALLAIRGRLPRPGMVQGAALIVGAASLAAIAYAPTVLLAALAAGCTGLAVGLAGAVCSALQQTVTDPARLGRVTSVCTLFTMGVAPLCHPLVGGAVGAWGTGPVFLAGASLSAAGGAIALCAPALRSVRLAA